MLLMFRLAVNAAADAAVAVAVYGSTAAAAILLISRL